MRSENQGELTRRYRRLADLWTARYFGVKYDAAMWPGLVAYAAGGALAQVPQYEAMLKQAGTIAEDRRFLHWELEFPEVFFDRLPPPKRLAPKATNSSQKNRGHASYAPHPDGEHRPG